ncbi:hypothetical protein [Streptomyces prasinopilosus]|uniref:hypothetical protein n=1 Tax=Streptomyces prasinopilosus TaxID=67344 RepID=UPI0006EB880B|nr:hypothetical protein [Streptomyces prasinopilosus]
MSDQHLNPEDVAAMRRQGDLRAFMRQGIRSGQGVQREGVRQFQQQSSKPPANLPDATGHVPGAWPVGPSDAAADTRTTCTCTRCRSYAKEQPGSAELLRRTQTYLDRPNA